MSDLFGGLYCFGHWNWRFRYDSSVSADFSDDPLRGIAPLLCDSIQLSLDRQVETLAYSGRGALECQVKVLAASRFSKELSI